MDSIFDELDYKILNELKTNARFSFAEIGREVGLSPSATRDRIAKLEDRGVISGYTIQTNNRLLGYDIKAFVSVKVFHGKLKLFLGQVGNYPEVKKAYRITGDQNVLLSVMVKDRLQLQHLIDQLMEFGDTTTQLVLSEIPLDSNV